MDKEITVPNFCNYTDLREKKEVPAIEAESIKNYARGLKSEEMDIFLGEVSFEKLHEATLKKYLDKKFKLDGIERYIGL